MRLAFCALLLPLAAAGSSAAAPRSGDSAMLDAARAEWAAAEAETRRLEAASDRAAGKAAKLAIERQAAASAIAAAEARISAAEAELRLRQGAVALARRRLAQRQEPVAALVAGLINLERRPPLLTLADRGSIDELVQTRALLDGLIPYVRRRSAALSSELAAARRLEAEAGTVAESLRQARLALDRRQERFAELERRALDQSSELGAAALLAGDEAIVAGVGFERLGRRQSEQANARRLAALLAALPPAPPRPAAGDTARPQPSLSYRLPIDAPLTDGHGAVSRTGIRSRGIRLDSRRGAAVVMPADGEIAFSGPFRRHDGVVIVDHGGGWMTMLVGVRASAPRGTRLKGGDELGTALGEVTVELSHNGTAVSPAMMAARSRSLSIQAARR